MPADVKELLDLAHLLDANLLARLLFFAFRCGTLFFRLGGGIGLQQSVIGMLATASHDAGWAGAAGSFMCLARCLAEQAGSKCIGQFAFADAGRTGKQQSMRQANIGPRQAFPYFTI
jgi:hypothetical protein